MRDETRSSIGSGRMFSIPPGLRSGAESGQIMVSLLLMLAIFLRHRGICSRPDESMVPSSGGATCGRLGLSGGRHGYGRAGGRMVLPNMGFTPGTPADCTAGTGTICFYANANGYNGSGIVATSPSNSVTWSFPTSVPNVTTPPGTITSYPFLKVVVTENVKTHSVYPSRNVVSEGRGLVHLRHHAGSEPAPMAVLNPTASGAFTYTGGGRLTIVGGPQRALQVNSTSPTAINCQPSGWIDTSLGGPNGTGSSVGISGGPSQAPTVCWGGGFKGGTTGGWTGGVLPVGDPYAAWPFQRRSN